MNQDTSTTDTPGAEQAEQLQQSAADKTVDAMMAGAALANHAAEVESAAFMAFVAALVLKAGGHVELTAEDMRAALEVGMEIADRDDGGSIVRVVRPSPIVLPEKVLAKPDGREPGEIVVVQG